MLRQILAPSPVCGLYQVTAAAADASVDACVCAPRALRARSEAAGGVVYRPRGGAEMRDASLARSQVEGMHARVRMHAETQPSRGYS